MGHDAINTVAIDAATHRTLSNGNAIFADAGAGALAPLLGGKIGPGAQFVAIGAGPSHPERWTRGTKAGCNGGVHIS